MLQCFALFEESQIYVILSKHNNKMFVSQTDYKEILNYYQIAV